jgi:serine phosphatase RsbU (regulator of sigma subunit)
MDTLVIVRGPQTGRKFPLTNDRIVLGRQTDSAVCLESQAVSRHHAQVLRIGADYFVEDLGSSNGTYVNGKRISGRVPLIAGDQFELGPYTLALRPAEAPPASDSELIVREQVSATATNTNLFGQDAAHKLQVVLEIAQHLGRTLDFDTLLGKLLDYLLHLFPQADRGMVLLTEGDHLRVQAQRSRRAEDPTAFSYSRTVVKRALDEGIGLLSEDVRSDSRFQASSTITGLKLRSVMCVPLIGSDQRRLGVIQLDHARQSMPFRTEELQLFTAISLQVATVLENAALHFELLREERFRRELALAHDIQQGFLPTEFPQPKDVGYELFARVVPARLVSGDLYDFVQLPDKHLAFFVGDVSGKGMPAALFMVAVRTLCRHLAAECPSPSETLRKLNADIAADNKSAMFVTLAHGIYDPASGETVLASAGHPKPLLRHADGNVEEVPLKNGMLLGCEGVNLNLADYRLVLQPGETLILYTDGFTEARAPDRKAMFDLERLMEALGGPRTALPLRACADYVQGAVERFTDSAELQDDLTILLLRRL